MSILTVPERSTGWADHFSVEPGYLNAATMGLPPLTASLALAEGIAQWGAGRACAVDYDSYVQRGRELYAGLVGVGVDDVAVGSQTSVFAGMVAASVPAGGEVLCVRGDFSSMTFPFEVAASRGISVRYVPLEGLAESIDERTSLVAFSLVQSACGSVADLPAVTAAAAAVGVRTFVDVTQAAGWLPFDARGVDFSVCSGYKWLCGPRGTAFFTVRPSLRDELSPVNAGWYAGESVWDSVYGPSMHLASTARRFDISPAWLSWVGAVPALELLCDIGVENIRDHNVALANALREGLGLPPSNSAIVSVQRQGAQERLEAAGIRSVSRAGKVRMAFHLWNTPSDVALAVDALR